MKPAKSKSSLRRSLVIPGAAIMLVLSLGFVGVVYWTGDTIVNTMSLHLIRHMTRSIRDHVGIMMDAPSRMLERVRNGVARHHIALSEPHSVAAELYGLLRDEPDVDWLYFANEAGGLVSNGRLENGIQVISMTDNFQAGVFREYDATADGRMTNLRKSGKYFDAREKDWYKTAKQTRRSYWTKAYLGSVEPVLGISLSIPVIGEGGEFVGAFGLDLILTRLSEFMAQQHLGDSGRAFVVDDDGYLIASSGGVLPVVVDARGEQQRLRPEDARDPVVHAIAGHLNRHPGIVAGAGTDGIQSFIFEDIVLGRISAAVAPFPLSDGGSWLIVSALPASDFSGAIRQAGYMSLGLMVLLVFGSLAVGFWTVGQVLRPLYHLTTTAHVIADGEWPEVPETHRDDEIGVLARALANMTQNLRKAQEELVRKEKLAILGQLSGSVGHELRNPLGVMSNAVYFLKTVLADADETTKEYLGIIQTEIDTSLRIITDLLDFARTKAPRIQAVTARALIDESLGRCTIPENVALQIEIPDNLPPLKLDPLQMGQVLENLIMNAVQAMATGGILTLRGGQGSEGQVQLEVADTGEGISPENMKNLFQPLFTTKPQGIGLGMVVCRNLTEANGGRIGVESAVGKGTMVTLRLPTTPPSNRPWGPLTGGHRP